MERHVLITGASTGIGRACALRLGAAGWKVHAGVRKPADGQSLEREGGASVRAILIDITDTASVAAAARELEARLGESGLTGLVNNAGVCIAGPVECVSVDEWRRQFEINVFGHIAVTQAMLHLLRKSADATGAASIVMMSSIAGRAGQPILGPYCASKFALEAVSDALRCELAGQHIRVSILEPGAVKSEIWRKAQEDARTQQAAVPDRYRTLMDGIARMAADAERRAIPANRVALQVERCLSGRRPPIRRLIGFDAKASAILVRVMPRRLFDRLMVMAIIKQGQRR